MCILFNMRMYLQYVYLNPFVLYIYIHTYVNVYIYITYIYIMYNIHISNVFYEGGLPLVSQDWSVSQTISKSKCLYFVGSNKAKILSLYNPSWLSSHFQFSNTNFRSYFSDCTPFLILHEGKKQLEKRAFPSNNRKKY